MPNWCMNGLDVVADEDTRKSFLKAVTQAPKDEVKVYRQDAYILENLVPRPEPTQDWYQWSLDNWGTKWADDDTEIVGSEIDLAFVFATAWSPPCSGVRHISKLYPTATFILTWDESGMCFMGGAAYRDGAVIHEINVEGDDYPSFSGNDNECQEYCDEVSDARDRIYAELRAAAL